MPPSPPTRRPSTGAGCPRRPPSRRPRTETRGWWGFLAQSHLHPPALYPGTLWPPLPPPWPARQRGAEGTPQSSRQGAHAAEPARPDSALAAGHRRGMKEAIMGSPVLPPAPAQAFGSRQALPEGGRATASERRRRQLWGHRWRDERNDPVLPGVSAHPRRGPPAVEGRCPPPYTPASPAAPPCTLATGNASLGAGGGAAPPAACGQGWGAQRPPSPSRFFPTPVQRSSLQCQRDSWGRVPCPLPGPPRTLARGRCDLGGQRHHLVP